MEVEPSCGEACEDGDDRRGRAELLMRASIERRCVGRRPQHHIHRDESETTLGSIDSEQARRRSRLAGLACLGGTVDASMGLALPVKVVLTSLLGHRPRLLLSLSGHAPARRRLSKLVLAVDSHHPYLFHRLRARQGRWSVRVPVCFTAFPPSLSIPVTNA